MPERFWVKLDRNRFYREVMGCETDAKRTLFVTEFASHLFFGKGNSEYAAELLAEAEASHEKQHKSAKNAASVRWSDAKRIPKGNAKRYARTEQNRTVTEENKKSNTGVRFAPPSLQEVQDYCNERQNFVDASRFLDFYASNGWRVGKNPMKDWKAAVRTWEKNQFGAKQQTAAINSHIKKLGT